MSHTNETGLVSLVSPAYGESENLGRLVRAVDEALGSGDHDWDVELLLVVNANDPSQTPAAADDLADRHEWVTAVRREAEACYGNAVRAGLSAAGGDVIVPVMGDLADDIEAIPTFVDRIDAGADVVYASRFIPGGSVQGYPEFKLAANRLFNKVAKHVYGVETEDLSNGFSAYHRRVIDQVGVENLDSESFDVMIELKLRAHFQGFETIEVPVSWTARDVGESRFNVLEQGARYGLTLLTVLAIRLRMLLPRAGRPADPRQGSVEP